MNSFFEKQMKDLERDFEYSKIHETVPVYYGAEPSDFSKSSIHQNIDNVLPTRFSDVHSYEAEPSDFSDVHSYEDEIYLEPIYDKSPPQIMTNPDITSDPDSKKYFYPRLFVAILYFIIMMMTTILGVIYINKNQKYGPASTIYAVFVICVGLIGTYCISPFSCCN